ncbi:hypothetical protein TCON_2550 [Astathelohania contejeani]|uniref:Uncharacterized protein n=1 Tax=Astathelohania contejeani TaxID=164912 RepID=A0ABQ7HVQ0_9MICR|nr:hypothetical protein TCON_2550 [Thelohania contejeani]
MKKRETKFTIIGILYMILSFFAFLDFGIDLSLVCKRLYENKKQEMYDKFVQKLFYFNSCEINECIILLNAIFRKDLINFYAGVYFILFRIAETFFGHFFYGLGLYYITRILYCKIILLIYFCILIRREKKWESFKKIGASKTLLRCYDIRRRLTVARRLAFLFRIIPLMIWYTYRPKLFSHFSSIIYAICFILERRENREDKRSKIISIFLWLIDLLIHIYKIFNSYRIYKG